MSFKAVNWAFEQDLDSPTKFVLVTLADAVGDNGLVWRSIRTLAEMTSLSERKVQFALRDLEGRGVLTRKERHDEYGRQTSNLYELLWPGRVNDVQGGVHRVHPRGAQGSPSGVNDVHPLTVNHLKEPLAPDGASAQAGAREQAPPMPNPPEWLTTLRRAKNYNLDGQAEARLVVNVSAKALSGAEVQSCAESLASQWPYKQHKQIDLTLLSWLARRDGNGRVAAPAGGPILLHDRDAENGKCPCLQCDMRRALDIVPHDPDAAGAGKCPCAMCKVRRAT